MKALEILELISKGESSTVQFKDRLPHQDSLVQEMVAFSNTEGGLLIIGVNDKTGSLNGLSFDEIQTINRQLVNEDLAHEALKIAAKKLQAKTNYQKNNQGIQL